MKTIAVIFGGQSTEHDVSIVTAIASIIKPLLLTKEYRVIPVYIAKNGSWYIGEKLSDITTYTSGSIQNYLKKSQQVHILVDHGLVLVKSGPVTSRKQIFRIDLVFPAMHGTHGEDGHLMGLLEMAGVPYVGCGVAASSVAMDKVLSKQLAESANIPSTPWVWFMSNELHTNKDKILADINKLKYPLFVKPAHLGSSIGISKVNAQSDLMDALEVAAHYDDKVIVEQAVNNLIEVTLPIMGNLSPKPALLEQPIMHEDDFFDFDTKYMQSGKKGGAKKAAQGYSKIPADLPESLSESAIEMGVAVYKALGCEGIARVDMLVDSKQQKVYFNEVNPLPGGLYAHNWNKAGISKVELVQELIKLAEERWQSKQNHATTFTTNYLGQFNN